MANNPPVDVHSAYEAQQAGTLIVDVRENDEFAAGHAEGAVLIPMSEIGERYKEIPNDQEVLIICKSGGRSAQVCHTLDQAGYNVTNIAGGSMDWLDQKLPFVSENDSAPTVI